MGILFLCSLLPLATSVSINAGIGYETGQFLHATLDWKTGKLSDVQYQPRLIKGVSINAPCFFVASDPCPGADMPGQPDCLDLMCRDTSGAFSPVCHLNSTMQPYHALLDDSRQQLFIVTDNYRDQRTTDPQDRIVSLNTTTCGILWENTIPSTIDKGVEEFVFALGLSADGSQLYGKADGSPEYSFIIDPSSGNFTYKQAENPSISTTLSSLYYDSMGQQWSGVNTSGPYHDCSRALNMYTVDHQEKATAYETFPIPPSWYHKYCDGGGFISDMVVVEDGKVHAMIGTVYDAADNAWNAFVTFDAHTGKLLAAVEIQYPSLKFGSSSINPSATAGCPGGSVSACTQLCPSNPPSAYKACVKTCAARCS